MINKNVAVSNSSVLTFTSVRVVALHVPVSVGTLITAESFHFFLTYTFAGHGVQLWVRLSLTFSVQHGAGRITVTFCHKPKQTSSRTILQIIVGFLVSGNDIEY